MTSSFSGNNSEFEGNMVLVVPFVPHNWWWNILVTIMDAGARTWGFENNITIYFSYDLGQITWPIYNLQSLGLFQI